MSEIQQPKKLHLRITTTEGNDFVDAFVIERTFNTGSKGFGYYGKVKHGDKSYQVSINIVRIGSKEEG